MGREHPEVVRAHIRRALDDLQEAQNHVGRALQHLSAITGGALPTYNRGHKLYDQVHAYWYRVNDLLTAGRLRKLGLDHEPSDRELAELGLTRPSGPGAQ